MQLRKIRYALEVRLYVFFADCCNLPDIHKSGTPGFASGIRLADYAGCIWSALILCGVCVHVYFFFDDNIRSFKSKDDKALSYEVDRYRINIPDHHGTYRLFNIIQKI